LYYILDSSTLARKVVGKGQTIEKGFYVDSVPVIIMSKLKP